MYHAEVCPVCNGSGKYKEYSYFREQTTSQNYIEKVCHGCQGKGWISVRGNDLEYNEQYPDFWRGENYYGK